MTPAKSRVDAGIWSVPGHAAVIEYSRSVLNEILLQVMDAFETYFAGGYEVGGVLYGTHSSGRVRIMAYRALDINPPRPSFVLSKKDEQSLRRLLEEQAGDPELVGMAPVGWYHSHSRSEIFLSESDLEIYDTYFAEPWQIALVFRPSEAEPVRAGFFFRETDGFIRTDQSYQEISFDPPERRGKSRARPPWEVTDEGDAVDPPLPSGVEAQHLTEQRPVSALVAIAPAEPALKGLALRGDDPRNNASYPLWRYLRWGAVSILGLGLLALSVPLLLDLSTPEPAMGLDLLFREGDLHIRWNPNTAEVAEAESATLFIVDGSRRIDRPLAAAQLRRARETYRPNSSRVDVRLQLNRPSMLGWGRSRQEIATYMAHPDRGKPTPELLAARQELRDAEGELNRLRGELLNRWQGSEKLQVRADELSQRRSLLAAIRNDAKKKMLASMAARDLPTAPDVGVRQHVVSSSQLPPQPEIQIRPPAESPQRPVAAPAPAPQVQSPAAIPATPSPKPQPPVTASSGRFLWTGDLPRNGVLTIDGRKATNGLVTGELPGVPVRVGAYPAELTGDMIKVYTSNPRFATQPRTDEPNSGNGWNKTLYTFDQRAVRDLIVEQLPSTAAPRRLVVRAGPRNVSVILIEWQVVSP